MAKELLQRYVQALDRNQYKPSDCAIMAYEYDVFISYRRHCEWPTWVKDVFYPLLLHWLGEELPNLKIFIDYDIETGTSWPQRIGQALGRSKVLVPLFSRQYFSSPWCKLELAHMLARETSCGFRTGDRPQGLVVPAHIHDGEALPERVKEIQAAQLQKYTNVRLSKGSATEERLSEAILRWVPDIAAAINAAPGYDEHWTELAVDGFVQQFAGAETKQIKPPSLG